VTTEDTLRSFIVDELRWDQGAPLTPDYPLLTRGVVDSLGILSLVSFIESTFGVQILDEELVPEHFETIADIASLIDAKVAA
jgi:acyl carrier protein